MSGQKFEKKLLALVIMVNIAYFLLMIGQYFASVISANVFFDITIAVLLFFLVTISVFGAYDYMYQHQRMKKHNYTN